MANITHHFEGRLALLSPETLSDSQKKLYDQLQATEIPWAAKEGFKGETENNELIGPFNAMLRAPEISTALLGLVSALKKYSVLDSKVQQVIILTVGAVWKADYELYAHTIVARNAGISEDDIHALVNGQSPVGLAQKEMLAYQFTSELATKHLINADLYQKAVEIFGENGVMDILVLAGQYMIVSGVLNTFSVPAPTT